MVSHAYRGLDTRAHSILLVLLTFTAILAIMNFGQAAWSRWEAEEKRLQEAHSGSLLRSATPLHEDEDPDAEKLFQLDFSSILTLLLSFVVSALANAAGVGGGAFFVPMFNILVGFSLKGATALSQAVISGGAVTSVLYSLSRRHPTLNKPLIDFDLALVLTPMMLLGVSAGVLFNRLLPNWLLTMLMIALLAFLTSKTLRSGIRLFQSETKSLRVRKAMNGGAPARNSSRRMHLQDRRLPSIAEADEAEIQEAVSSFEQAALVPEEASPSGDVQDDIILETGTSNEEQVKDGGEGAEPSWEASLDAEGGETVGESTVVLHSTPLSDSECEITQTWTPPPIPEEPLKGSPAWLSGVELLVMWVGFLLLQYLKSRQNECSAQYAALLATQAAATLSITAFHIASAAQVFTRARSSEHEPLLVRQLSWPLAPSDPSGSYTPSQLTKCAMVILGGSCIAGLLGIGGGMILGPLLISLGVHPLVTASTSALLVLFSSSTATLTFALDGCLNLQLWSLISCFTVVACISIPTSPFAMVYGVLCAVASLTGVTVVGMLVKRSGRTSLVVLILALIIGAGGILTLDFGGMAAIQDFISGENLAFKAFCRTAL